MRPTAMHARCATPTSAAIPLIRSAALWAAGLFAGAAVAASPFAGGGAARVDDAALDGVRGGFTSPDSGLHISFGVQRAVYVNGNLATTAAVAGSGALLQIGAGNLAAADGSGPALVVQNTLDNQKIQTVTTIDVTTNGLSVSRGLALQSTVGAGIAASLRR